jgi:hypothetical protein
VPAQDYFEAAEEDARPQEPYYSVVTEARRRR